MPTTGCASCSRAVERYVRALPDVRTSPAAVTRHRPCPFGVEATATTRALVSAGAAPPRASADAEAAMCAAGWERDSSIDEPSGTQRASCAGALRRGARAESDGCVL